MSKYAILEYLGDVSFPQKPFKYKEFKSEERVIKYIRKRKKNFKKRFGNDVKLVFGQLVVGESIKKLSI